MKDSIADITAQNHTGEKIEDDRIRSVSPPNEPTTFAEWRTVIMANFPDLVFPAEICASIIAQILIRDITNPFALILVGAPSSGKTICVNFFDRIEGITYSTDAFSSAAFVSSAANIKKKDLADIHLLPRIKNKTFLVRDLATIFSKRDDDLNEILGKLVRLLDGEGLSLDTGSHGRQNMTGSYLFMMIAASTPIPGRVWKMMGHLGSRLFFYNIQSRKKTDTELVAQLRTTAFKEKEYTCRDTSKNLLSTLWDRNKTGIIWDRNADSEEISLVIVHCSKLLARTRGLISRWFEKHGRNGLVEYEYSPPVIENPDRLSNLFYNLCRGHAVLTGRNQINTEDLKLVVELAIDSAPPTRARLFRGLVDNGGVMTTTQVQAHLECSKTAAGTEMRTLEALGVCKIVEKYEGKVGQPPCQIQLAPEFEWFLSEECRLIRGSSNNQ